MQQRRSKSGFQLRPPTLRVDSERAWRQGEDAVILPIIYEPAEPKGRRLQPDSDIVAITWPMKLPSSRRDTSIISLDILNNEQDRKKKLSLLKNKVESAKARVVNRRKIQDNDNSVAAKKGQPNPHSNQAKAAGANLNSSGKAQYFSIAVPLLLFGVIALVVVAWLCFR